MGLFRKAAFCRHSGNGKAPAGRRQHLSGVLQPATHQVLVGERPISRLNSRLKWNGLKPAAAASCSRLRAWRRSWPPSTRPPAECAAAAPPRRPPRAAAGRSVRPRPAAAPRPGAQSRPAPLGQPRSVSSMSSWQSQSTRRLMMKRGGGTARNRAAAKPPRRKVSSKKRGWTSKAPARPAARCSSHPRLPVSSSGDNLSQR
jgi:hypothetical protein